MKTIITNVQQFEETTNCSHATDKNIIDMNKILNKIKEKRNGHYVHALEAFEVNELMEVVQHIISEFTEEEGYTKEDIKNFFNAISVYHLEDEEADEETNEIRQDEIYSFDFDQYIDNLYE